MIMEVPSVKAVTSPLVIFIFATEGLLLIQVPPVTASVYVVVVARHILVDPVIGAGVVLMVTSLVL